MVDWRGQARMLECTPKLLPFIQQSQTGTLNLNTRGVMVPTWSTGSAAQACFHSYLTFFFPCCALYPHLAFSKKVTITILSSCAHPNSFVLSMSSPPNEPNPPPNTFDNMRLPAYRSSYLGRYHPYPRTRAPAREVVMVCALLLLADYSNMQYQRSLPHTVCCGK